ncbi:MAG TPA: PAS domain-containing protein [bacterium]|nr:PAS domain-containing protein [bacterium]
MARADEFAQEYAILAEVVARTPATIALLWTPRYRVRIANDRWLETFPSEHPVHGQRIDEVLPAAAPILIPLLDRVCRTGDAFAGIDVPLPSDGTTALAGYCYFTLTMSPVAAVGGGTGGVLVVCTETTHEVRRRRQIERELTTGRGIADALQRCLLPGVFSVVPGVVVAAHMYRGTRRSRSVAIGTM